MTYLIDISGNQVGLDINAARDAGNEAVIVKAVAAYRPEHTVAEGYHSNIDRTIAAGLPKGHYLVPNNMTTPAQSAKFLFDNRYRPDPTDIYMLDNEPLDTYKVYWRDDNAAAFFEALHELGIRYDQMWLYCPAALTRAARDWPKIKLLRLKGLKIVWVSYGDSDPYLEPGEEPFTGDTGLTNPEVHQFTSTYRIPGYNGNVDRNYSPLPINELFGGPMALKNYVLRSPSVVIADDNRDPWVSWQHHLERTGRGGVDVVAVVGTPIYARTSGVMLHVPNDGTAGNSCRFQHDDNPGWRDVFSHLSRYVGVSGQHFNAGEIVAYTGDTGGVTQHLHWHLVDPAGNRQNPWNYFSGTSTAGGGTTPIGDIVALKDSIDLLYNKDRGYLAVGPGFVYQVGDSDGLTGNQKLAAFSAVGLEPKTVETAAWDALNIIFLGNQAAVDNAKYTASLVKIPDATGAIDVDALAAKIAAAVKIPAGGGTVDPVAIAKAVRAEFKANPLS